MLNLALRPSERHDRPTPETPPESQPKHHPREPLSQRTLLWVIAGATLALLVLFVARHFDEYLRRTLEAKINQRLQGYSVSLGGAHLNPLGLSLTLERAVIWQDANPKPPVANLPRLTASVEWREILHGHLVANATFVRPSIHINLPQLRQEDQDKVEVQDRGWQDALQAIYPLKFNLIEVRDGDITYIDEDPEKPLQISRWNFTASNIRNIRSEEGVYPSPVHTDGVIFGTGRGVVDGHADFLAKPFPGFHVKYQVQQVPLDRLKPVSARADLSLSGGILSSNGRLEYGPKHKEARIDDVTVSKLRLEYQQTTATAAESEERQEVVAEAAQDKTPEMLFRIGRFELQDSHLGLVSQARDRRIRLFLTNADFEATNLSSGFRDGPVKTRLTGAFMGNGSASGSGTFRNSDGGKPDFDLAVKIEGASLRSINDILRAYGKFDVVGGTFSVYSEMKVANGRIDGYVKPLFKDVDVYDSRQDKKKPVLKKIYEKIVGGLSHVLENKPRDQVATVVDISGPLEEPNTSTWETIVRLVSNAFVKAILPGFEREAEAAGDRR
jgi:Domain of Unknown Function (DUF748)